MKRLAIVPFVLVVVAGVPPSAGWDGRGLAGGAAWAQVAGPDADPDGEEEDDATAVDTMHKGITSAIVAPSQWLDSFFGDPSYEIENNRTRLKVRLGALTEKGDGTGYVAKVGFRLALPRTNKRLNLIVGGDADDDSELANNRADNIREETAGTDSENAVAGLQYFLRRTARDNLSTLTGFRARGGQPVGILGARYRRSFPFETWQARFTQRVQWFTDNGFVVPSRLDFEQDIRENQLFRQTLYGTWFENESGYFYGVSLALRQRLGSERALIYEWDNQFETRPTNRLEETSLRLRYRQAVWREWLKFDLMPQLSFPRDRGYDITPGIYAGIEISFGG